MMHSHKRLSFENKFGAESQSYLLVKRVYPYIVLLQSYSQNTVVMHSQM